MKFFLKYGCFFLLCALFFKTALSQTRESDRLYHDFLKTKDINQKMMKAPSLVLLLGNQSSFNRADSVIMELQKLQVSGNVGDLRSGIVLFSKALLLRTKDSIDLSITYAQKSFAFFKDSRNQRAEANSLIIMNYFLKSKFDSCIQIGNRVKADVMQSQSVLSQLELLLCVGRSYDLMGNRKKAIELSLQGAEIAKKHGKVIKLAELYINLSSIYKGEDEINSKKYALQSLKVLVGLKNFENSKVVNASYLIIGNVYYDAHKIDSATYYYNLCMKSSERTKDRTTYLSAIGNLGNVAYEEKQYSKALEYNLLTLHEYRKMGIKTEIAVSYGSLADIYKDIKDYKKAIKYYDSALKVTEQIHSADDFIYNYKGLSETYEMMGNEKEALKYYKLYRAWNDSVNNNQSSKKINEIELDYKYKAEQREKDLIQKSKDIITQEKIKQQTYIIWAAVLGGLCLVIFLGFTVKSNVERKKTNKQLHQFNEEISEQKNIIEEKNNEITDSITYASRIQQGVIPDEEELQKLLPQHFVFFRPRDIVSGDFYWASKVKSKTNPDSKRTVVAVVDCTGHGVPGAFMSLVGNTLLNQTIGRSAIETPAQALDYINAQLPKTIKSKLSTGTIKDGMEVAMCDFHFDTLTMYFAGANSNIYLVRNGEIQIYKGDKQPIGESLSGTIVKYSNQVISLQKNDCVYLISDGYADQFGGEKGKKFKYKPLENLFCTIAEKDVNEQREILAKAFDNWKSHHEQVDDVLIMGIKI